jgi:adenylate cyclase
VIVEEHDIFGDGVNIAARLEGLAAPGGICVSGTVRDHIGDRLPYSFEDMGEQSVKNIARPVRVFCVGPSAAANEPISPTAALPLPDKPSIAVLPFANLSGDPEQEYFAQVGAAEVGAAQVGDAQVGVSQVSGAQFGVTQVSAAQVGAAQVGVSQVSAA